MFPSSSTTTTTNFDHHQPPFFPFSLPFLDDELDGDLLHSLSMIPNAPAPVEDHHNVITQENFVSNISKKMRRSTGKKDRHSKICTAHGLRDRRMRLSVKVARKFFDLQDMLDFDKASKTIEWLLVNSRDAIQELAAQTSVVTLADQKSVSSSASMMSEVLSETYKEMEVKPKRKRRKTCRAAVSVNPLARESRDMARARARERTREKMINSQSSDHSRTRLEAGGDSGFTHAIGDHMDATTIEPTSGCYAMTSKKPSLNMNPNLHQHNNNKLIPSTSPPSSIFMTISKNNGHWSNPSSFFAPAPINPISSPNFMSSAPNSLEGITNSAFSASSSNIGFESHGFMGIG